VIRYLNAFVGEPEPADGMFGKPIDPQLCRLRDLTYNAPIYCEVKFRRGQKDGNVHYKKGRNDNNGAIKIGRLPLMLRSNRCAHIPPWQTCTCGRVVRAAEGACGCPTSTPAVTYTYSVREGGGGKRAREREVGKDGYEGHTRARTPTQREREGVREASMDLYG
jgi:DNA-directed RNA polymerase beta subunit